RAFCQLYQPRVVNIAGRCHYEVMRHEFTRMKGGSCLAIESCDRFSGAFDWPPQSMRRKVSGVEKLRQQFIRRVFDHLDLFENYLLLALQIAVVKTRVGQHV